MSPETTPTPGQPAGPGEGTTPPTAAPAAGTEGAGQKGASEFLTRAEADALEARVRSYADKGRVRVEKAVQTVTKSIADLRALGKEITPAEEKTLKDTAIQQAMVEPDAAPAGQLPPQADQQVQLDPEIVTIQRTVGVELYDGDPELAKIDRQNGPYAFYKSVEAAAIAKKARMSSTPPEPSNPALRSAPLGNPPSGITPDMPAREAWQRVEHKK